jgi:hypothetical protein
MTKKTHLPLLAGTLLAGALGAQTIVDFDQVHRVESDGTSFGQAANDIGNFGGTAADDQRVFMVSFVLPDLGGQTISDVDLGLNINSIASGYNADLYAVRLTGATGDVTNADPNPDHQTGTNSLTWDNTAFAPTPASTKIQDNFLTGSSSTGINSLSTTGSSSLVTYLDDNYEVGGVVYFALAADATGVGANFNRYRANNTSHQLTITAIPEPSTFALFAGALGLGLVLRRRRRS